MDFNRRLFLRSTGMTAAMGALGAHAKPIDRPNILWLTCEDNNVTWIGCYGNKDASTPNIDKLATEGFRYTQCYSNGAVCSATRSSWITGMYSPTVGIHNHRSKVDIPASIPLYPELLKSAGYFVANHGKQDYNIVPDNPRIKNLWDSSKTSWNDTDGKPFFQVINLTESHESKLFGAKLKDGRQPLSEIDAYEGFEHDPQKLTVRKYHPDIPGVRATYARYYDAISKMDTEVGKVLAKLEEDGLAENTIVIHNSDHGGALPRGKRYMENSGTHCPLIVRIPEKYKHLWPANKPGMTVDRLVSFYDMPKTWIKLAGGQPSPKMQGRVFLGPDQEPEGKWHFSYRGRNDARPECSRAVRDKKYVYIRNYLPFVPKGQYLSYQWKILAQREWEAAYKAGKCDEVTGAFFLPRAMEELYDTQADPDCVVNLVKNPEQQARIKIMRKALADYTRQVIDVGFLPEADMLKRAKDNGVTVYEMAQNPKLYDLDAYLSMADLAITNDPTHLKVFINGLKHDDSGVRYWAAMGCMILGEDAKAAKSQLLDVLDDESHEVRAMAAWSLMKLGETDQGVACIKEMLKKNSYAKQKVLNVIDWMGEDGKSFGVSMRKPAKKKKR